MSAQKPSIAGNLGLDLSAALHDTNHGGFARCSTPALVAGTLIAGLAADVSLVHF